jgi:molecular chaperone GrpE
MSEPEKPEIDADSAPADSEERGMAHVEAAGEAPPSTPEERLQSLQAEVESLKDQLLRKRAEFENFRRRVERDRQNAWNEASADIFRALVPTLDNLERALKSAAADDPLREGVALVQRELLTLLETRGLTIEDPTGTPFDPERHQALSQEAVPGAAPGTVVETLSKGYLLKDRLLRPALVKVAKDADAAPKGGAGRERVH